MRNKKRWLKQVIKAAANQQFKMPRKPDTRPVAFSDANKSYEYAHAA